jgi:hypothetical protein
VPYASDEERKRYAAEYYEKRRNILLQRSIDWGKNNPDKVKAKNKAYYLSNRDEVRDATRRYYEENKESVLVKQKPYRKEYYARNRDVIRIYRARYLQSNPDKHCAVQGKRRADKLKATPGWADADKIKAIYRLGRDMTELTGIEHHVDHIVPLKSKLVCGLHCESNLRVVDAVSNLTKGNTYWPDMP